MIKIENVKKSFSNHLVFEDINLAIEEGSIFGLVGINGAGKSTLLRCIAGIYQADQGTILINDKDVFDQVDIKKEVFFLPDDPYYFKKMNGRDVKKIYESLYDMDIEAFHSYIKLFNLSLEMPLYKFSKGMRRRFFISIAFAIKPKYLILDEAFDGLDPQARLIFKRVLIELKTKYQTTIIIASHSLRELEDICDTYGLLDGHHMRLSGHLIEDIEQYRQYQVAFKQPFDQLIFKDLNILKYNQNKSVAHIIVKGNKEETINQLNALNPMFIEELDIDFESLFLLEVEEGAKHV
ncbi:MAG: ABC transporter ATP-binding protein [Acholeplasmataceae bacterium]